MTKVSTINGAVTAYGGEKALCRAFRLRKAELEQWRRSGVSPAHALGLFLGLRARGHEPSPWLFGVERWGDVPGA
jgi:hypothetical protein